jgi:hypothetical protein
MSAHPISFDVLTTCPVGDYHGDRYRRAYIDGRRVSLAEARDIAAGPYVTLSSFTTTRSRDGLRWHHRKTVTI